VGNSNLASLGSLRIQARQRSDLENNPFISDPEFNQYINQSYKELYDMLVGAYGDPYFFSNPYYFTTNGGQYYPLPDGTPTYLDQNGNVLPCFYKLSGVDLQYSASPNGWVTLQRFEFIERNKYAYSTTATVYNWWTNLKYSIQGNQMFFSAIPPTGVMIRSWYVPAPTNLQYMLPCNTTQASTTVAISDTTGLSIGMNVYGSGIPDNTVISTLSSTSLTISNAAMTTKVSNIISYWDDATTLNGIAGWEESVILGAAIKAMIKQESDPSGLISQWNAQKERIEAMSQGRDIGQASHVSDALSIASFGGFGGDGYGSGWGSNWGY